MDKTDKKLSRSQLAGTVIGVAVCVLLLPLLIMNLILIVKSFVNSDEVPSIGGVTPMIVLTDSMDPVIKSGDLIFAKSIDPAEVAVGDVITFFDPAGSGTSTVTPRAVEAVREEGLHFRTKGDANNTEDRSLVPAENLIGVYRARLPGMGQVAMFLQTTPGLLLCVVLPLGALVAVDLIRRKRAAKAQDDDRDQLLAQLEALKAEMAEKEGAANASGDVSGDAPGDVSGGVSGDASGSAPGDASGDVSGNVPGGASGSAPGDASGSAPGGAPGKEAGSAAAPAGTPGAGQPPAAP